MDDGKRQLGESFCQVFACVFTNGIDHLAERGIACFTFVMKV